MGYVIPAGFARVNLEYAALSPNGSKPTWGFGVNRPPSEALCTAVLQGWVEYLRPFTSNSYTLERVTARSDVGYYEILSGTTGPSGSPAAPPNTCALIKLATGMSGRTNRGRVYPVGLLTDNSIQDVGTLDPEALADIQQAWNGFVNTIELDTGAELVILHSTSSDPTPVTSQVLQGTVATQRRRLRR